MRTSTAISTRSCASCSKTPILDCPVWSPCIWIQCLNYLEHDLQYCNSTYICLYHTSAGFCEVNWREIPTKLNVQINLPVQSENKTRSSDDWKCTRRHRVVPFYFDKVTGDTGSYLFYFGMGSTYFGTNLYFFLGPLISHPSISAWWTILICFNHTIVKFLFSLIKLLNCLVHLRLNKGEFRV